MSGPNRRKPTIEELPYDRRFAAAEAFLELGNTLMRASQIMFRRAGYVMNPDPKVHGQILRSIRNYQTRKLPCFDQLTHIEARLRWLRRFQHAVRHLAL